MKFNQAKSIADHELKTDSKVFNDSTNGKKRFEIRFNDREYKEDQLLLLRDTVYTGEQMKKDHRPLLYTGRWMLARVSGILQGPIYGLKEGWVILSTVKVASGYDRCDCGAHDPYSIMDSGLQYCGNCLTILPGLAG